MNRVRSSSRGGARHLAPLSAAALICAAAGLSAPPTATGQSALAGTPPALHVAASGEYSWSAARVTVDARMAEGSSLTVTLNWPSGRSEALGLQRESDGAIERHSWTGRLDEPGAYSVEAVIEGPNQDRWTDTASLSLAAGEPQCSLSLAAPSDPTLWWLTEITVNTCDSGAVTGDLATGYVVVTKDGVQVASLDMAGACERTFHIPWEGDYEASVQLADNRGVEATCSSNDVGVDARHPRAWLFGDVAGGIHRTSRPDIGEETPATAAVAGGGLGLMIPHQAGADRTFAFFSRAAGGRGAQQLARRRGGCRVGPQHAGRLFRRWRRGLGPR